MKQIKYKAVPMEFALYLYKQFVEVYVRNVGTGSLVPVFHTQNGTFTENAVKFSGTDRPSFFTRRITRADWDRPITGWLETRYNVIKIMEGEPVCRCPRCQQTHITGADLESHYIGTQEFLVKILCVPCRRKINAQQRKE